VYPAKHVIVFILNRFMFGFRSAVRINSDLAIFQTSSEICSINQPSAINFRRQSESLWTFLDTLGRAHVTETLYRRRIIGIFGFGIYVRIIRCAFGDLRYVSFAELIWVHVLYTKACYVEGSLEKSLLFVN
jgi:hypothetical protein